MLHRYSIGRKQGMLIYVSFNFIYIYIHLNYALMVGKIQGEHSVWSTLMPTEVIPGKNVVVEVKEKDNRESVLCCIYMHIYFTFI